MFGEKQEDTLHEETSEPPTLGNFLQKSESIGGSLHFHSPKCDYEKQPAKQVPVTIDRAAQQLRATRIELNRGDRAGMGMDRLLEISRVDRDEVDCLVAAAAGQNRASRIVRYACRKLGEAAYNAYERSLVG